MGDYTSTTSSSSTATPGAIRPIDGLNLELEAGSLTILLGPSGSGKTTLLSCLGGILTPTSGRITFGDEEMTALDRHAFPSTGGAPSALCSRHSTWCPASPARENVMVPLRAARMSRGAARERAEELLTQVNLEDRMGHRPGDLSGGQQQRVAVARAIALDPPLILPTNRPHTWTSSRSRRSCG